MRMMGQECRFEAATLSRRGSRLNKRRSLSLSAFVEDGWLESTPNRRGSGLEGERPQVNHAFGSFSHPYQPVNLIAEQTNILDS